MTAEDMQQELDREPFVPLRLHLASGQKIDVEYPGTAWVRQNTLLVVHPIGPKTSRIGEYDVISLRLIERIELVPSDGRAAKRRRKAQ
jgi:hypothetical protein